MTKEEQLKAEQIKEAMDPKVRKWFEAGIYNRGETESLDELVARAVFMVINGERSAALSKEAAEMYFRADASEAALVRYELALSPEDLKALDRDTYTALVNVFYDAKTDRELDLLKDLTVAQLVALHEEFRVRACMEEKRRRELSELDGKTFRCLWDLRWKMMKSDPDAAETLGWAISNLDRLEHKLLEKQTEDLLSRLTSAPETEINSLLNTGFFDEIIKGYVVTAMRGAMIEREKILDAVRALEGAFTAAGKDTAAARRAYRELSPSR